MADLSVLRSHVDTDPAGKAFTFRAAGCSDVVLSRSGLDTRARAVAAVLQRHGAVGRRVLVFLPCGPDFLVALLGCLYAGAVAVPCAPPRHEADTAAAQRCVRIGRHAEVAAVLAGPTRPKGLGHALWLDIGSVADAEAESWVPMWPRDHELTLLQCSSGSTGRPKIVMVSAGNLLAQLTSFRDLLGMPHGACVVGWVPPHNSLGLALTLLSQFVGGQAVWIPPEDFVAAPYRWLDAVSRSAGPVFSGAPNFAYDLCVDRIDQRARAGLDLSRWQATMIGAERIRAQTCERFLDAFGPWGLRPDTVRPTYGLTEVIQAIASGPMAEPVGLTIDADALSRGQAQITVAGTQTLVPCGKIAPDARVIVVDRARGEPCPDGVVGEVWIAGPMVCQGYWRDEAATNAVFGACLSTGDGPWLRTGDLGFVNDGKLVICGRIKELIIMRGRNFHPEDIETTAQRAVADGETLPAAAFAVDSPDGERLVVVQSVPAASTPELAAYGDRVRRAVTADHGLPVQEVVLVEATSIPRTPTGKIQREACRQAYLDGTLEILATSDARPAPAMSPASALPLRDMITGLATELREPVVSTEVRRRLAELLTLDDPGELPDDTPLVLLGLDSVRMISLRHSLEQDLGVSLPIADFVVLAIADLVGVILGQLAGAQVARS
jgi:acyl-CoA synthetase (AMP-forming)/AMP-acid ligase II/aryl carrier-like protein